MARTQVTCKQIAQNIKDTTAARGGQRRAMNHAQVHARRVCAEWAKISATRSPCPRGGNAVNAAKHARQAVGIIQRKTFVNDPEACGEP